METGTGADQYCLVGVNPDGTGGTQKNNTTLKTCAFDATLLVAKGQWPAGAGPTETRNGRFTVILRRSYDSTPAPTGGHEALFVLASPSGTLSAAAMTKETSTALAAGKTTLGSVGRCPDRCGWCVRDQSRYHHLSGLRRSVAGRHGQLH